MTAPTHTIIITGFMGAGKTTIGTALARKFACAMIDLDKLIEERDGRTAQAIIDEDGEQPFREIESAALRDALATSDARIIALGGGTWTIEHNRALIHEHGGLTVWLDAPFELCWKRIESEVHARPLARERAKARRLYDERRPIYSQALLRVKIDGNKSARAIAEVIVTALGQQTKESND
jgi:shikimate kinase